MSLLLDGEVVTSAEDLQELRADVRDLKLKLAHAELELKHAKSESARAVGALRRQLQPLYGALRAVFGEIDAIAPEDAATPLNGSGTSPRVAAVWESWKTKLGKPCGQIIDALLVHRSMNQTQISIATGINRKNIPTYMSRLKTAGLTDKNGNEYSLKQL